MTVGKWRLSACERLAASGDLDAAADADWLLCASLGVQRSRLGALSASELDDAEIEARLLRRLSGEPLGYVLGETDFMGLVFKTDTRALIPRFETELMCELAIERARKVKNARVLDLCAGTGALGLTLAKKIPGARVTLADISGEALALAGENMLRLGVSAELKRGDLFAAVGDAKYDIIMCNPPYVKRAELPLLQREVLFEPRMALDGGEDGLDFYRRIASGLDAHMTAGALALFEVGAGQAEEVRELLGASRVHEDLNGIKRVVSLDKGWC